MQAGGLLEPFLCKAVTVTGSTGKTERLFRREGTLRQRNFRAYFNQKNKIVKKYFGYLHALCMFVCRDRSTGESGDRQEEAGQNKEGSELESVNSLDINTSWVQPSRYICHVVCIATEVS